VRLPPARGTRPPTQPRPEELGLPVVRERTILCLVDPRIPRAAKRGRVRLIDADMLNVAAPVHTPLLNHTRL
jgi:hypothetical protein